MRGVGDGGGADDGVWYFAYGSNMSPEKRQVRAGVRDLDERRGRIAGWRLAFDVPGLPPAEPSMASLRREPGASTHGLLLKMSAADFAALVQSEGGARYYEVVELDVETYEGEKIRARTFVGAAARRLRSERPPSRRYLDLIRESARALALDPAYLERLDALPSRDAPALARLCSELVLDAYMAVARSPLGPLAGRYLGALQATDELPGASRLAAQGIVLAPALALGAGVRALRAIRGRLGR